MIVEDSSTTAEYIKFILESAGGFEVFPVAADGEKAVSQVTHSKPDVILMDINMPRMNGFEATRVIMETNPVPIVIFSASWDPEDVKKTFQAMDAGALAVLEKPPGPGSPGADKMTRELVQTLRLMSEVPLVRRTTKLQKIEVSPGHTRRMEEAVNIDEIELVAIGASTGGPPALYKILSMLPWDFPAPIMVVQHISTGFLSGLARWLDDSCAIKVQVGRHRDLLKAGRVYLAPDELHMGVAGSGAIVLSDAAPEHNVRPSVSHLFRSVAFEYGRTAAGILLTGMGRDGAQELGDIKKRGGITIAQDEESSVVHGMPGEAIKLGNAAFVKSPEEIGETLKKLVSKL